MTAETLDNAWKALGILVPIVALALNVFVARKAWSAADKAEKSKKKADEAATRSRDAADLANEIQNKMLALQHAMTIADLTDREVEQEAQRVLAIAKKGWRNHTRVVQMQHAGNHPRERSRVIQQSRIVNALRLGIEVEAAAPREEVCRALSKLTGVGAHVVANGYRVELAFDESTLEHKV